MFTPKGYIVIDEEFQQEYVDKITNEVDIDEIIRKYYVEITDWIDKNIKPTLWSLHDKIRNKAKEISEQEDFNPSNLPQITHEISFDDLLSSILVGIIDNAGQQRYIQLKAGELCQCLDAGITAGTLQVAVDGAQAPNQYTEYKRQMLHQCELQGKQGDQVVEQFLKDDKETLGDKEKLVEILASNPAMLSFLILGIQKQ